jgi:hypothetical protein
MASDAVGHSKRALGHKAKNPVVRRRCGSLKPPLGIALSGSLSHSSASNIESLAQVYLSVQ